MSGREMSASDEFEPATTIATTNHARCTIPPATDQSAALPTAPVVSCPLRCRNRTRTPTAPTPAGVSLAANAAASWAAAARSAGRGSDVAPVSCTPPATKMPAVARIATTSQAGSA